MANKISYVKQGDPSFIQKFKQQVGYKEGPDVDTKRQKCMPDFDDDDDDRPEPEDEKPVVVVLKEGDLTAEEAESLEGKTSAENEDNTDGSGRIMFKKPVKRTSTETADLHFSSGKKKKEDDEQEQKTDKTDSKNDKTEKRKDKKKSKPAKNTSLLSFNEEEDDDV